MRSYVIYVGKRVLQFALVVFVGISITFLITHLTPIDPVEHSVAQVSAFGFSSPESIELLRQSLRELYGVGDNLWEEYLIFWQRLAVLDFGPSLSAFPTPVSELIGRAIPWTIGLLTVSTILSWLIGNVIGGLAGYYNRNRILRIIGMIMMGLHPVPYYIIAFVLLIVFTFMLPILPSSGGYEMNMNPGWTLRFFGSVLLHSILPAFSLILVGVGSWFMGMRALVSNIVTDDYVTYASLAGVPERRLVTSYVMRNAFLPQITGLAMSIGAIFNGAVITEQVFGYPGIGRLLVEAVHAADYSLVQYYDPTHTEDLYDKIDPVPYLKFSAVHSETDKTVTMFMLNRHLSEEMQIDVAATGFGSLGLQRAHTLHHEELKASNTKNDPDKIVPHKLQSVETRNGRTTVTVPPASWSVVRFNAAA